MLKNCKDNHSDNNDRISRDTLSLDVIEHGDRQRPHQDEPLPAAARGIKPEICRHDQR